MFRIKWRQRKIYNYLVITGISIYATADDAAKQVEIWKGYFPQNSYYIIPTKEQ